MSDYAFIMYGLIVLASAVYLGLSAIADAIRHRRVDVNLPAEIHVKVKP